MYYTVEERTKALQQAVSKIDNLTKSCSEYTRGINDCFALLVEYDLALRGESKARDLIKFRWSSTKDFVAKLAQEGYDLIDLAEYSGYEIVWSKRPELGDVAFYKGVLINDGDFWVSTKEDNSGVADEFMVMLVETRMPLIARPIRS